MNEPEPNVRRSSTLEATFVALLFATVGIAGVAYGARSWMPELASRHGAGIDAMLHYLLVSVGALFLTGHLVLGYFIWGGARRREIGPRLASRRTELVLSGALGLGMALIAEGGVVAIGMPVWTEIDRPVPIRKGHLSPQIDLYNIFNANPIQDITVTSGSAFLRPINIVPPRVVRFGLKFDW